MLESLDGLAIIETLTSREMSSSVFTFTKYETVMLTTVSTKMIYTCDKALSLCE